MKKICSIQFAVELNDISKNQEKVKSLIEKTYEEYQPEIILLPETSNPSLCRS
ncbi:hypothetical protein [Tepidibacillus marianensis]|uniref:hypothetical protein n=1 Tax=Tepidibacillus marianensis TaxID=3131995 RepID=UPI0030CB1048